MIEDFSLVSIITPTFNNWKMLKEMIISIQSQTYQNWECIIVDDGSTDETSEKIVFFLEEDSRIKYFKRPDNLIKGANSCRNYGFLQSKGEYINWFDSDDVMLVSFLQTKLALFNNIVDLVVCSGLYADSNLNPKSKMKMDDDFELFKDYLLWKQHFITNSVMFKRGFLKDKELFNPNLKKGQEAELFSRLFFKISKQQYKICNVPLFLYRVHEKSSTSINGGYRKDFKESESFVVMGNLYRSIELGDKILIKDMYDALINLLFKAIKYEHTENIQFIMNGLDKHVFLKNRMLSFLLKKIVFILGIVNLSFLRWDYLFRRVNLK